MAVGLERALDEFSLLAETLSQESIGPNCAAPSRMVARARRQNFGG